VALRSEIGRNRTIGGEAALHVPRRLEPLHPPLSLPRRLMGVLRSIVEVEGTVASVRELTAGVTPARAHRRP
jgi:hypothetical protein